MAGTPFPTRIELRLKLVQTLPYGENPHQRGAFYGVSGGLLGSALEQIAGPAASYLNIADADAAWRLVSDLGSAPAAVIVKHANPCGASVSNSITDAYLRAFAGDPKSAFGGIVGLNQPLDVNVAEAMLERFKADVLVSPGYVPAALDLLTTRRPNLRIIEAPPAISGIAIRQVMGGFLVQEMDAIDDPAGWIHPTRAGVDDALLSDLRLAWTLCMHVKSNAAVLVRDGSAVGIGAGQQSRVDATTLAIQKAGDRARGAVCASDAFLTFADAFEVAAEAGIAAFIQPGGSKIGDAAVIAAADAAGVPMVFTGRRHFRH